MRILMRDTLSAIITCGLLVCAAHADNALKTEMKQLRSLDAVTGSVVGSMLIPGKFYLLSKVFIEKGTEKDFVKLSEDENPVVRSMGLFCLAQQGKSIGILKEHISDSDKITYFPGGSIGWTITVGRFVREIFYNVNCLDYEGPVLPVLSNNELIGLDIEILSKDSTASFHIVSAGPCFPNMSPGTLHNFVNERDAHLALPDLKRYTPELESYQIIKAIGRLGGSEQQREFLISCVRDESLDKLSRLAAASALTRDANETALSIIRSERIQLNGLTKENLGDRFLETMRKRILHEKLMKGVRELTWQNKENVYASVIKAFSNSHPIALPDLTNDRYLWLEPYSDKICEVAGNSLVEMSKNLEDFNRPWNIYSDTAYALSSLIPVYNRGPQLDSIFTPAGRSEIEKNVKKAIENHFEVSRY